MRVRANRGGGMTYSQVVDAILPRYEIVESKVWRNKVNGRKVSIYGALPWWGDAAKVEWELYPQGWTIRDRKENTVGLCRVPWKDEGECIAYCATLNAKELERKVARAMADTDPFVFATLAWRGGHGPQHGRRGGALMTNERMPTYLDFQLQAIATRRDATVKLDHAIARIGYWDAKGWLTVDDATREAVYIIQHAKWGIEAMDSPATNRFWDSERANYDAMLREVQHAQL